MLIFTKKTMKKILQIIMIYAVIGISTKVSAQEAVVKGVLFEKGTNIRIALAEIINLRTKLGVGSNDLGMFSIRASVGDTLVFQKSYLTDQYIIVKNSQDLIVYMVRQTNQLEDVTVKSQSKKDDFNEIRKEFKNKGVYNNGKPPLLSYFFSPLNALYSLFGKDPKNARRFNRYADNEIKQSQIDQYFNPTMVKNYSNLEGDRLEKYLLNCRPEYEVAQHWNTYDYIKYIKDSSKKFTDTLGKGNQ